MSISVTIDILSKAITIFGFPLLIYSIILLVRQLRLQSYQAVYEAIRNIDQYFVENPEYRKFFYEAKELPDDQKEIEKILAIADMLMTFFEHAAGNKNNYQTFPG